jgi:hypothetical protein
MPALAVAAGGRFALAGDAAAPAPRAPALAFKAEAVREIVYADAVRAAAPVNHDVGNSLSENPFRSVSQAPQSTFALADHTASYASVRNSLNKGQLPPRDAVCIEGLVNYFRYGDEAPAAGLPFGVQVEVAPCPWKPEQRLVRIAVNQGRSAAGPKAVAALDAVQETERGQPAAGDVRLQAEFSPARVAVYRLIGDDSALNQGRSNKEAGTVGALRSGQSVNAFYQVIPTPSAAPPETAADAAPASALAKARPRRSAQLADGVAAPADTLLTVTLRWEPVDARDPGVLVVRVPDRPQAWEQTSPDMQFGSAVALFGMLLRQSPYAAGASFDTVLALATPAVGRDTQGERAEFLELVRRARTAQPAPPPR